MFKVYQKYIVNKFIKKFFLISLIFFSMSVVLGVFEEISFFKNNNGNIFIPYFLTLLNAPITLFEIFPFIFLISAQFFFYELFKKDELLLFKNSGLSNLKLLTVLFISSFFIGVIINTFYYNFSSKLKFFYTDFKNNYSEDNKYLAAVNDSGLWLKDEIDDKIMIIKAVSINNEYLNEVIINIFDKDFNLLKTIQSEKINIDKDQWDIFNPTVTMNNVTETLEDIIHLKTSFDQKKINNLFSNIMTLNITELIRLKSDYEKLGYSSDEINFHLMKLISNPFFYSLMTILASIIMLNVNRNISPFFYLVMGIFLSVVIYYLNYMIGSLGNTGKLPVNVSVFTPIILIAILTLIGLVSVNEK